MKIESKLLGRVEFDESSIIQMSEGLIGISGQKRFVLLEKEDFAPFGYFQAIDDPSLSLVVINPFLVEPEYQFYLSDEDLRTLEVSSANDFQLLAVVVFSAEVADITVNLKAPILINIHTRKAKQVILLNNDYGVSEPLIKPSTLAQTSPGKS